MGKPTTDSPGTRRDGHGTPPHPNPARILEKESFLFKNDKSSRGPGRRLTARTDLAAGTINV